MTESEFSRLLKLYQQNKLPEAQRELVDKWLEMKSEYKDTFTVSSERLAELEAQMMERIEKAGKQRTLYPMWFKAAAAVLLLAIVTYGINIISETEIIEVRTASAMQKVMLPDGTIVWLKGNSMLSYPEEFEGATRNVSFTGEALFEVTKDPNHPFIIQSGKMSATVRGTSFNLKTIESDLELTVLTGKVSLAVSGKEMRVVTARQKAVYKEAEKQVALVAPQPDETAKLVAGTEYNMLFKDALMKDIVKRLEDKFNVKVELANAGMNTCLMTGDFTDQSLNETLGAMAKTLGFVYEVSDKEVKITGEGCQ